jgi:hypothetical protein
LIVRSLADVCSEVLEIEAQTMDAMEKKEGFSKKDSRNGAARVTNRKNVGTPLTRRAYIDAA